MKFNIRFNLLILYLAVYVHQSAVLSSKKIELNNGVLKYIILLFDNGYHILQEDVYWSNLILIYLRSLKFVQKLVQTNIKPYKNVVGKDKIGRKIYICVMLDYLLKIIQMEKCGNTKANYVKRGEKWS